MNKPIQQQSSEWHEQWSMFEDKNSFLLSEWIYPATLEDFRDMDVLECGCGGGQHIAEVAPYAKSVTAVDLNTVDIAIARNEGRDNIELMDADLVTLDLGKQFDIVYCIGVIHHTDDPDKVFERIYQHCKPGGKVIIWTYSAEGNAMVRYGVEPVRKLFLKNISRNSLLRLSKVITALLYPLIYTVYMIPFLSFLPYFQYFKNARRMTFERNVLNVFDKLNAPQTRFTTRKKCDEWMGSDRFKDISITPYVGVSYSLVGTKI